MNKGFTLVELIGVIVILGLLAIITTPAYDSISNNIKTRNYKSKQNTIKSQTLDYVEKYLKDEVYGGTTADNTLCFTVNYLIRNGIISSDDEQLEYISNEKDDIKFDEDDIYIKVSYNKELLKLEAEAADSEVFDENECNKVY